MSNIIDAMTECRVPKRSMRGIRSATARGRVRMYYRCESYCTALGHCGAPHFHVAPVDAVVWTFACELARNPDRLLRGYRALQQQQNEQHSVVLQQLAIANEQIAAYQRKLDDMLEMHAATNVQSLKERLLINAEEYAQIIDSIHQKRAKLEAQLAEDSMTDEQIESRVEFIHNMQDELEHIDQTNDLAAKCAALAMLKIRTTLRIDAAGDRWVDIHWAGQVQSKPVSGRQSATARG